MPMCKSLLWRSVRQSMAVVALCAAASAAAQSLPASVAAALGRAQIPASAMSIYVAPVESAQPPRLTWQPQASMNPASVMKLVTTYAALEQLGPTYVWRTPL